jgi:hypothetical protein
LSISSARTFLLFLQINLSFLFYVIKLFVNELSTNFLPLISLQGLETYKQSPVKLRPKETLSVPKSERINSYRFSMANLEETQEAELDSILTELSLLEQKGDMTRGRTQTHSRSSSIVSGANSTISTDMRESSRTESPDNDSAFSDTVSLLSSESSASSGLSSLNNINKISSQTNVVQVRLCKLLSTSPTYAIFHFPGCKVDKNSTCTAKT